MPAVLNARYLATYNQNRSTKNEASGKNSLANLLQNREVQDKNGYLSDRAKSKIKTITENLIIYERHNSCLAKAAVNKLGPEIESTGKPAAFAKHKRYQQP